MTFRQFALPLAALLALGGDVIGQEAVGRSVGPNDGQLVFNNSCRTCHSLREGDNRLGPNLHKILGRRAGSLPNYGYSDAMRGADLVWDKATLDRFIASPEQVVSGNKMKPYGGLASAEERAKIVAFLEANGGS
jgi:cytochrome c